MSGQSLQVASPVYPRPTPDCGSSLTARRRASNALGAARRAGPLSFHSRQHFHRFKGALDQVTPRPGTTAPPIPWNEKARLEALHSYEVLDTPPEPSFDDITRLAALVCGTPIALISLVDEARTWFKSRLGIEPHEFPRELTFCSQAILQPELFVVPDFLADERFATHPLVVGPEQLRFYAGAPLVTPEGFSLGTVCVIDRTPRTLTPQQLQALEALARQVIGQLELRRMNLTQKRLIGELQASAERFAVIQRATHDIVCDWDLVNQKISWNERIHEVLGYSPQDIPQDSSWWYHLVHPDDRERVAESFRSAIHGGKRLWSDEYRLRRANGTYARVLDRGAILRNAAGEPVRVLGTVLDMSEREEMRSRLALADRMASVGTLAAGVVHEINNPLAYVIANLDYARQEIASALEAGTPPEPHELPTALKEAREGAERMRLIVRDLKTFSRPDDVRMEPVDLPRAIDSAVTLAWNELRHRARLVKIYEPVPPVWANEARLGQVFLNLLINAAHAIPEGAADRHEIRVRTRVDAAGRVVGEVQDTGAGIPEEHRARILEPFFTTKPPGEGTGLGLSICHGIIKSLGGELQFDSEVGKGTVFRVVLTPPQAPKPREANPAQTVAAPRRGRILAVDDEQLVLNAMKRTLGQQHEVIVFSRARAALAWLEQGEPWDVLLCDLMMPEMTGMEFHAELSRRMPERAGHVIFVTGGAFTPGARDFLARVNNLRVEKPFDPKALRELVNAQLRGR
ncbi:MAG: PAS domain-containing protein [Myxococcaceae bacterium]|nr:PAS domain-containing protein [Myxococcaceae bacterium]